MMLNRSLPIALLFVLGSCSAKDETTQPQMPAPPPNEAPSIDASAATPEPSPPTPDASEPTASVTELKATVASVQLQEDCPDAAVPASPASRAVPATPARRAPSFAPGPMPCIQSRIQIAFTAVASSEVRIAIKAARLLAEDGTTLSDVAIRAPSLWSKNGYTSWDEVVAAGATIQASYKIAPPDWRKVEAATGKTSFGQTFLFEIAIDVVGKTLTIRSNPFTRQQPTAIPT